MAMKIASLVLLVVALCHAQAADDKPAVEGADATIGRQLLTQSSHYDCKGFYDHGKWWYDCGGYAPKCYKDGNIYYYVIDKYCKYVCYWHGNCKKECHYPQVIHKPVQGPQCGYVYCQYGQICCKVPKSWGHLSYGPQCYPNVATQDKCYSHCPSWHKAYPKKHYPVKTWHNPKPVVHYPKTTWTHKPTQTHKPSHSWNWGHGHGR